jgi:D-aspartate ligase
VSLPHVLILEPSNGGLAVARSLVRDGFRVSVVVPPEQAFVAASRGVEGHVVRPHEWVDALTSLVGEGPVGILAGADRASVFLAEVRHMLPATALTFEHARSVHVALMQKDSADAIARRAGVLVPWTASAGHSDELATAARDAPFPCVLKPVLSHEWRAIFGQERVLVVNDRDEALRRAAPAFAAGLELVMSEYVPGADDAVEEAIVVRAADGSYPVRFGCRKLRQFPRGFGAASICVSAPIPESQALTTALLDEAGFVGVVGVEVKRHAVTGDHYFIEANVRLPTQFGLGDVAGADASRRLVAALAGEPLGPPPVPRDGVKLVFPELEVRAAATVLRGAGPGGRRAAVGELLRSYRGTRELGLLDPRDTGPLRAQAAERVRRRLRRRSRA